MKRKIDVRRHVRRTKKGFVPVRKHTKKISKRKNYGVASVNLNTMGGRTKEDVEEFGFDYDRTLAHGTSRPLAEKILADKELKEGTAVKGTRGGLIDAKTWAENVFGPDKEPVVLLMETEDIETKPFKPWVSVGRRKEEREELDITKDSLPFKKGKILKIDGNILDDENKNFGSSWKWNYEQGWPGVRTKIKLVDPKSLQRIEPDEEKSQLKIDKIVDSGDIREPVKVWNKYKSNQKLQVSDGHHRVLAAIKRKDKLIPVEIRDSPWQANEFRRRKGLPYRSGWVDK